MLSKNKIKLIRSLQTKKGRETEKCYVAEGDRIFKELIQTNSKIIEIIALPEWIEQNKPLIKNIPFETASRDELHAISSLTTPQSVLCIVAIKGPTLVIDDLSSQLVIALDRIQDPGNMGTIIRVANWFGIHSILCSNDCVDIYNAKVVQATMGAICKTDIFYCDLANTLQYYIQKTNNPIYGTFLEGENIYTCSLKQSAIIVLGNEGNGISHEIEKIINSRITIPSFNSSVAVESLNVSIAASIVCSEFKRRIILA